VSVDAPSARRDEIVAAARQILESQGPEHLTMRALAERLEIRAPSLYKHVADKDELETLLIAEALRGMGEALHAAIPGSKLVVLPGIGHMVNLEAPERFNGEVRSFLRA